MFLNRSFTLGFGILLALVGVVFVAAPAFVMSFFDALVGICLIAAGLGGLLLWFHDLRGRTLGCALSVVSVFGVLFGLFCLARPLALATTISLVIAQCVVIAGIVQLIVVLRAIAIPGRSLAIAGSVLVIVFGICAFVWPTMLVRFVGIAFLAEGLSSIALALLQPRF